MQIADRLAAPQAAPRPLSRAARRVLHVLARMCGRRLRSDGVEVSPVSTAWLAQHEADASKRHGDGGS